MPTYIVFAQTVSSPVVVDHITAADLATAQARLQTQLAHGVGVNADGSRDQISYALILADAAGTINPTP